MGSLYNGPCPTALLLGLAEGISPVGEISLATGSFCGREDGALKAASLILSNWVTTALDVSTS